MGVTPAAAAVGAGAAGVAAGCVEVLLGWELMLALWW